MVEWGLGQHQCLRSIKGKLFTFQSYDLWKTLNRLFSENSDTVNIEIIHCSFPRFQETNPSRDRNLRLVQWRGPRQVIP